MSYSTEQQAADTARQLFELSTQFVKVVAAGDAPQVAALLAPGSNPALLLAVSGLEVLRLYLHLNEIESADLQPYDGIIEPAGVALIDLAVLEPLPPLTGEGGQVRYSRRFGSCLSLVQHGADWLIDEVLPHTSDARLDPQNPRDAAILALVGGENPLPLLSQIADPVEQILLEKMNLPQPLATVKYFNLEEKFNALRLWRDYLATTEPGTPFVPSQYAAAVCYLILLWDYPLAEQEAAAHLFNVTPTIMTDTAREIASTLRVTQFDDRYSLFPDPVAHYRELFLELGINPKKDEEMMRIRDNVFDSVEPLPDEW